MFVCLRVAAATFRSRLTPVKTLFEQTLVSIFLFVAYLAFGITLRIRCSCSLHLLQKLISGVNTTFPVVLKHILHWQQLERLHKCGYKLQFSFEAHRPPGSWSRPALLLSQALFHWNRNCSLFLSTGISHNLCFSLNITQFFLMCLLSHSLHEVMLFFFLLFFWNIFSPLNFAAWRPILNFSSNNLSSHLLNPTRYLYKVQQLFQKCFPSSRFGLFSCDLRLATLLHMTQFFLLRRDCT